MFLCNLLVIVDKLRAVFIKVEILQVVKNVLNVTLLIKIFYQRFPNSHDMFLLLILLNEVPHLTSGCW